MGEQANGWCSQHSSSQTSSENSKIVDWEESWEKQILQSLEEVLGHTSCEKGLNRIMRLYLIISA